MLNTKLIGLLGVALSCVFYGVMVGLVPENKVRKYHRNLNQASPDGQYDFIIVGSGTAGSVLANRLSANKDHQVLLLEAGPPDEDLRIKVPAAWYDNFGAAHDWEYNSVPQERSNNKTIYHPRGKTIGGSSSINAMIYLRGSSADYD